MESNTNNIDNLKETGNQNEKVLKTLFNIQLVSNENNDTSVENKTRRIISKKVGRNEPCPCGSGKKYKQCHGA